MCIRDRNIENETHDKVAQDLRLIINNNIKRYVFGSTVYVYSNLGSFYRISKQACENYIEHYQQVYNLDYERGVKYSDPTFKISFPHNVTAISKKDASWKPFEI